MVPALPGAAVDGTRTDCVAATDFMRVDRQIGVVTKLTDAKRNPYFVIVAYIGEIGDR